jgi:hypothetical protein
MERQLREKQEELEKTGRKLESAKEAADQNKARETEDTIV